jgi:hypothetical protein
MSSSVDCPTCSVHTGSTCRTRGGKVAPKYHTPCFMLVPQLRTELEVKIPAHRGPSRPWETGPAIEAAHPGDGHEAHAGRLRPLLDRPARAPEPA